MTDLFGKDLAPQRRKDSPTDTRIFLFAQKWDERYLGEKYVVVWSFDRKMMNELKDVPLDTVNERLDAYMADAWYENCRHSMAAFVKNFNKFVALPRPKPAIQTQLPEYEVDDAGHKVKRNELCPVCFPKCTKCGEQHIADESCEAWGERMAGIKKMFGS